MHKRTERVLVRRVSGGKTNEIPAYILLYFGAGKRSVINNLLFRSCTNINFKENYAGAINITFCLYFYSLGDVILSEG